MLGDVDKLLLIQINEKQLAGDTVTENFICEKAKALYTDLVSKLPGTSTENEEDFKASWGCFANLKRSGIQSVVRHREAAGLDAKAAEVFATEFQKLMVSECYLLEKVFNCDGMGLFLQRDAQKDLHYRRRKCNAWSQDHEKPSDPLVLC